MMRIINMLRVSGTLRALVVAGIAWALAHIGLADQFPDVGAALDHILAGAQIGAIVWAALERTLKPNPSLTQTAANKAVAIGASAKEVPILLKK